MHFRSLQLRYVDSVSIICTCRYSGDLTGYGRCIIFV